MSRVWLISCVFSWKFMFVFSLLDWCCVMTEKLLCVELTLDRSYRIPGGCLSEKEGEMEENGWQSGKSRKREGKWKNERKGENKRWTLKQRIFTNKDIQNEIETVKDRPKLKNQTVKTKRAQEEWKDDKKIAVAYRHLPSSKLYFFPFFFHLPHNQSLHTVYS